MIPKKHREINSIELVWGRSKAWVRKHCKYTIHCLRDNVPKSYALAEGPIESRRGAIFLQKGGQLPRGIPTKQDWPRSGGGEKYKSHRRPAPSDFINRS